MPVEPVRRLAPGWLFAAGCLLAAVCIPLTARYHRDQQADSLIPVLSSLYGWEPFFWEQNRVGMPVPLLASPVAHPLANLLVQSGTTIFLGLAALGVVAWYFLRDDTAAAVGAVAAGLFLAAFHEFYRFHSLNGINPYLQPAAMALVGILLAGPGPGRPGLRLAGGLLLTGLAYWSNLGLGVIVGPLVFGRWLAARRLDPAPRMPPGGRVRRWLTRPANREFAAGLGLTVLGSAAGRTMAGLSDYKSTEFALADPSLWAEGWKRLADGVASTYGTYLRATGGLAAAGLVWLAVPATRAAARRAWPGLAVVAAGLAVQLLFVGATEWIRKNEFDTRYLIAGVAFLAPAAAMVAVGPPLAALPPRLRWRLTAACAAAIPAVAAAEFGRPSVASARAGLAAAVGHWTADVVDSDCTHLVGNYWCAWPAMFHANLALADRGDPRRVWAVSVRSGPTIRWWGASAAGRPRVGWLLDVFVYGLIPPGPPGETPSKAHEPAWRVVFPHLREVGRRPTLWVYERADP